MEPSATESRGGRRTALLFAGPAVALCALLMGEAGLGEPALGRDAMVVAGVTLWMAIWWISEVVPIAPTSMLPLAVFPLLGVANTKSIAAAYFNPFIVLLMAGFMATTASSPCDVIKSRVMNQPVCPETGTGMRYASTLDCLRQSVRSEGVTSLWKGGSAGVAFPLPQNARLAHCL